MGFWDFLFGDSNEAQTEEATKEDSKVMKTGKAGQDLIKYWEKLKLVGYLPTPKDVPTIGWGSTRIFGRKVVLGETITEKQAQEQFEKDLEYFENIVNAWVKVSLTQNQFDALVSFVYNVGEGNEKRGIPGFTTSTLLKLLNAGDYEGAAKQFIRWNKQAGVVLPGLQKRRTNETNLFLS